jgi:hypothetical protein
MPIKRKSGQRKVSLRELLAGEEGGKIEAMLNRRLFACGCTESALAIVLALAGYIAWLLIWSENVSVLGHMGRGLLVIVAGAILGKAIGLLRAERRLKETIDMILQKLPKEGPWEHPALPGDPECY